MKNKLKRLFCVMLVVLCMASFSVTAFASGGDAELVPEATDSTATEEVNYSYTINADGSVVITINGEVITGKESITNGKVTTKGGRLNLRTGAGMSYEIIDQLRCGEEVTVIGTEGDWYEVIVPEKKGYVHSSYLTLYETAKQNSEIDSAMLSLLMSIMLQNTNTEKTTDYSLTPDGNLSLIDDFFQIEVKATEDTEQKDKQFITLQSKNGNYFYLIIDRNGETENVYFLNLVDEADLMALIEDTDGGSHVPVCTCTDKCVVGSIHTECEVCRTNMSECAGKEAVVSPEPTEPTEEPTEEKSSANFLPLIVLLIIGGAGGAVYWFKFRKPKTKTSSDSDLDDYDYGQDEDEYDEETELDDADVMAESESEGEKE